MTLHVVVPVHCCLPGGLIYAVSVSIQPAISFEEQSIVSYIKSMFLHNQQQIQHHKCTSTHSSCITLKLHFSYQSFILHSIMVQCVTGQFQPISVVYSQMWSNFVRQNLQYIFNGVIILLFLINGRPASNT